MTEDKTNQWDTLAGDLLTEFTDTKSRPVGGGRTITYIDARQVMTRLDECLGINNWTDEYTVLDLNSGAVECALSIHAYGETVTHRDVGYPQSATAPDKLKAAYSDALKRAAVKFGIGRHLYADAGDNAWTEDAPPVNAIPERQWNDDPPPNITAMENVQQVPKCPNDGSTMVKKDGRNGAFWGCPQYSNGCRQTISMGTFD
tara:strand:- start:913 stop:1518 length:606 start_codon:yes stop_codon:yes gene_type:complete